jgi:hypothetical protein
MHMAVTSVTSAMNGAGAELASWEVLVICDAVPVIIEANGDSDINLLEFMEGCRQTRDPAFLRGDCRSVAQM